MQGKFYAKKIKKEAKEDYEKAWNEGAKILDEKGINIAWEGSKGSSHPVADLIQRFREIFLGLGFDEVINSAIIEDEEVYRQYGPEAPLILDRVFYLAGLPRQDIGLSRERIVKIEKIIEGFGEGGVENLKNILREFKKGEIEGDDFLEVLVTRLGITESQAARLVVEVFDEFSKLRPIPSHLTLRSHMTASWFGVLSRLQTQKLPVKLYSIGSRFRREQRQDRGHLYESTSASIVVMGSNVSLEDGEVLVGKVVKELGLGDLRVERKKATSKYYAKGMEMEAYARFNGEEFEIADFGLYSPVSLANYKIKYPVLNLGFGIERVAMVLEGVEDIRELVYKI